MKADRPKRTFRQRLKRSGKRLLMGIGVVIVLFFFLDFIFPVQTDVEFAPLIKDGHGNVIHAWLTKDEQWRFKTDLHELNPGLRAAILFKEDRAFYRHPGFNPFAICRAAFNNIFQNRRTSGASTITMQVARLLEPKKRTYWNKVVELFRATQLELHYSKDEILELYLNLVPYGSNIQGVKAASLLYFNKSPDQLSLAELTALSIIPNRPNSLVMGRNNDRIIQERNKWLMRFRAAHLFNDQTINDALAEPLDAFRHSAPTGLQQLAWRLRRARPAEQEIISTIDAGMQQKAEDLATTYVHALRLRNIFNASVLVVDNQTHEVKCYIGSSDFFDSLHHGQVDGVMAKRSPGSTLKPFLYGLSFDAGIATPQTVLNDVPININGYMPENYDLRFRGKVTVEEALRQSLNIPAVKILEQLGVSRFIASLSEAGFSSVWEQKRRLGLSIILGGCTVRLDEMTALFSTVANGGTYAPLKFFKENSLRPNQRINVSTNQLLSPSASYMISTILCELHRPDLPAGADQAANVPHIAWKTGTSYGRKDAWSIGFNEHYTIGVWLGNFDGKGVVDLSGATTATPLLFQLFNALDPDAQNANWLTAPQELESRYVCRETGKLPADFCTDLVMDYYIPGVSRSERCDHQREVWVSADGLYSYCTSCLPATGYKTVWYPNVAADLAQFYDESSIPYERIPPHNPSCSRLFDGSAPVITSLTEGATYLIVDRGKQQLTLECTVANDVSQVYWYINDKFYKPAKAGEKLFYNPEAGALKISCTDDKGRIAERHVTVRFM